MQSSHYLSCSFSVVIDIAIVRGSGVQVADQVNWTQFQRLTTAAMFLRSCVAQALSRGD